MLAVSLALDSGNPSRGKVQPLFSPPWAQFQRKEFEKNSLRAYSTKDKSISAFFRAPAILIERCHRTQRTRRTPRLDPGLPTGPTIKIFGQTLWRLWNVDNRFLEIGPLRKAVFNAIWSYLNVIENVTTDSNSWSVPQDEKGERERKKWERQKERT